MTRLLPLAAAALLLALPAQAQTFGSNVDVRDLNCSTNDSQGDPNAQPNGHIRWPADDPVWEFDFSRPANSITPRGTGLELRDLYYDGVLVMKRANAPVLNVEYDAGGGCGCFRDWEDTERVFEADGAYAAPNSCFAEATPGTVRSTCEVAATNNGGDVGTFTGVSVEDYGDELVISSHMSAGWYRYRMKWHLYLDGRIWPEYSFAAASATCTEADHRHHTYWRFDFDMEGTPDNDIVREVNGPDDGRVFSVETDRTWGDPADGVYWSVRDADTGSGYDIIPSEEDLLLPVDEFSQADALVLRYNPTEMDDNSNSCAIDYRSMVNDERLDGEDIVFWYRSSALHVGGNPWECDIVGPTLRPRGRFVSAEPDAAEAGVEIDAAYPNPFSPYTTVRFQVATTQAVRLALYDALGREVETLFQGEVVGGRSETVRIEGGALPTGTYTVRLIGETAEATQRIVLVR